MYLLSLFNINSMCVATDTPKRSSIQKEKTYLRWLETVPSTFEDLQFDGSL